MKKNEVVLVKESLKPFGGLEKYSYRIASAFAKRGYDPVFLTANSMAYEYVPSFARVEMIPIKKRSSYSRLSAFDRQCKKWKSEHNPSIFFGLDRISQQTHLRAGNGVHRSFLQRKYQGSAFSTVKQWINPLHRTILQIEKKAFEYPGLKRLITNSHMVKNEVLDFYNVDPEKISVIHNGVEWKEFEVEFSSWVESKNKIARSLGLDPSVYHFLFIGHGYDRKGLKELLKGLRLLPFRDFHLSVIGKEKQIEGYQQLVQDLGLHGRVTFFGQRQDPLNFLKIADSLVIPSLYDPFANVTVEALAMGLFVITSKFNGGHEIISPSNGAIIADLFQPESVREALEIALAQPKTWISSKDIRDSIKHLDFSFQLTKIVDLCLQN